jgi:hypothetical protein
MVLNDQNTLALAQTFANFGFIQICAKSVSNNTFRNKSEIGKRKKERKQKKAPSNPFGPATEAAHGPASPFPEPVSLPPLSTR